MIDRKRKNQLTVATYRPLKYRIENSHDLTTESERRTKCRTANRTQIFPKTESSRSGAAAVSSH